LRTLLPSPMSDVTGTVCTYGDRARGRGVRINAHEGKDCSDEIALRKQNCIREEDYTVPGFCERV
jgi:hypothetical protein